MDGTLSSLHLSGKGIWAKKRCTKCGIEKDLSDFYRAKTGKDGYRSYCKECILEHQKEYYKLHKGERKEYDKKRYKSYYKLFQEERKGYLKKYRKEYRKLHKEEGKNYQKEYRKSLNGKLAHARAEHYRHALYKRERSDVSDALWTRILESQNNKCNICHKRFTKKRPPTQDHIVPISKGGSLQSGNIQALCSSCNSSKHAKLDNGYIQTWSLI